MLIQIANPAGVHIAVQRMQTKIHSKLLSTWGIDSDEYKCYGLAHRNQTKDGYVAEVFTGDNSEGGKAYREVYYDDSVKALSFFGLSGGVTHDVLDNQNIHLVFFVNVQSIYPDSLHRSDEEIRLDVLRACQGGMNGIVYEGTDLWIENVLREYPGTRRNEGLKYLDMHPKHCFRLNFQLIYDQKTIC